MVKSKLPLVTPCPPHQESCGHIPAVNQRPGSPFIRCLQIIPLRFPCWGSEVGHSERVNILLSHLSSLNPHPELGAFQAPPSEQAATSPSPRSALHFPWQEITGYPINHSLLGSRRWPALGQSASWLGGLPSPGRGLLGATLLGHGLVSRFLDHTPIEATWMPGTARIPMRPRRERWTCHHQELARLPSRPTLRPPDGEPSGPFCLRFLTRKIKGGNNMWTFRP